MEETINKNLRDFSKVTDAVQTAIIFLLALLVPSFLGQLIQIVFGKESVIAANSQFIVGTIVNACLVIAALNLKGWWKVLGVVTMPSISTILSGYIFNAATTVYMICMIPAIWIGNFVYVYAFKGILLSKNKNYFLAALVGIVTKVAIIFVGFLLIKGLVDMPEKIAINLQRAMSLVQLITATLGSLIAFGVYKLENK